MERFTTIIENARGHFRQWFMPTMAVVVLLSLFFVAGGGVSQNDKWRIDTIEITGANTVSTDAIRELMKEKLAGNYFFAYARENSYLYPQKEIGRTLLERFPRLSSVLVSRVNVHTIAVSVSERKPYALWCGDEYHAVQELSNCWFIDTTGFVFDRAPVFSVGVYMEVYGKLLEKNAGEALRGQLPYKRFTLANTIAQKIRAEFGETARVAIKDEGEIELTIRSSVSHPYLVGVVVRFDDEHTPEAVVKNLLAAIPVQFPGNAALKKKLLYIDMRFGNKIFFGFEN